MVCELTDLREPPIHHRVVFLDVEHYLAPPYWRPSLPDLKIPAEAIIEQVDADPR